MLPYLLTVLLTSGYLAEHSLIELANRWKPDFEIILEKDSITSIRDSIFKLMAASGRFEMSTDTSNNNKSISSILQNYMVGTEKCKSGPTGFPDSSLIGPIRNLPLNARKSIRKRAMEVTNFVGVQRISKKARLLAKIQKDSVIESELLREDTKAKSTFDPDYVTCCLFIEAIGYNIETCLLIGYRILKH